LQHSGFVCGSDFTMGDIPAGAMAYRWFNMEIDRPTLEALQGWYEKLLERPAYRDHVVMPLT
ncbi:MAG: glutathione S-transferase, partial [SAR324 cluster bacterium]|nr:glutathione S-transferase [SAR324 cluster bacterium]